MTKRIVAKTVMLSVMMTEQKTQFLPNSSIRLLPDCIWVGLTTSVNSLNAPVFTQITLEA